MRLLRHQPTCASISFRPSAFGPRVSEGGIAIVIVMISIFVLSILAGGFAYSMKVETRLARNANSETELEWLGRSAIECARWELSQQLQIVQEPYDGLDQVWAGGGGGIGTSNSPLAEFKHEIQTKDGTGTATWTIVDLERKANINTASEGLLQQALLVMGADAGEMTPVVNCILDWIDPDNDQRIQGAENNYYQDLSPPYYAKNGPIDDLSELLLIKDITPELYWGITSTNYQPGAIRPPGARLGRTGALPSYTVGFNNLFTPLSRGKININTASAEVLQLVPGMTAEFAQAIVSARQGEDDGSGLMGPYRSVAQVVRVPELPRAGPVITALQQVGDVRSYTFEVHVDAQVANYHRRFVGIIGRASPRDVQILSFRWEN